LSPSDIYNHFNTLLYLSISQDGGTPLFVACQCNHLDVVEELLERGADIHAQMVDGASPLFIAAQNGHWKMVQYLLRKGAKVDMKRKVRD
jgi:ankyrin repeat protein